MSAYNHQYHDDLTISPYSMGSESDDDDTYLKMDQFQERKGTTSPRAPNLFSQLDNVLTHANHDLAPAPAQNNLPSFLGGIMGRQANQGSISVMGRAHQPVSTQQQRRHSAVPNYTKWDPGRAARQAPTGPPLLTGPPPFTSPHRLTPKLPAKGPAIDDQEDYLTFDRPQPPYPGHGGPAFGKRPAAPVPQAHDDAPAPPRPPRSPMMHGTRQSYDDHFLPSARQSIPEDFPAVPPPRPPQMGLTQMGPPQVAPPAMGPPQWGSPQMGPQPFKLPSRNSSKSSGEKQANFQTDLAAKLTEKFSKANPYLMDQNKEETEDFPHDVTTEHSSGRHSRVPVENLATSSQRPTTIGVPDVRHFRKSSAESISTKSPTSPFGSNQPRHSSLPTPDASRGSKPFPAPKHIAPSNEPSTTSRIRSPPIRLPVSSGAPSRPPKSAAILQRQISDLHNSSGIVDDDGYECMGKATDPTKPAEEQPWFFDGGRLDAQNKIEPYKKDGMFLVRPSSGMQPYALTLWARGKFFNFVIRKRDDGAYALGTYKENECSHKTVVNLIEHHQNNELKLADNEGSIILTSPP